MHQAQIEEETYTLEQFILSSRSCCSKDASGGCDGVGVDRFSVVLTQA